MDTLPANRVTPAHAFVTCGVDYASPSFLPVCLFPCEVTKAVHIELSTDAFLVFLLFHIAPLQIDAPSQFTRTMTPILLAPEMS